MWIHFYMLRIGVYIRPYLSLLAVEWRTGRMKGNSEGLRQSELEVSLPCDSYLGLAA